jgi:hypothetical protein
VNEPKLDAHSIEILRRGREPSREAYTRVRAKLWTAIGAGGSPPSSSPPLSHGAPASPASGAAASETLRAGTWAGSKGTLALVAFLAGGITGAALYAGLEKRLPPRVVTIERPAAPSTTASALAGELTAQPTVSAIASPLSSSTTGARVSFSTVRGSQLAAERALLDEARSALIQGEAAGALERLERHRRTFANPILDEERDAMEVEALVKAGRDNEARARAGAFRKRSPTSLFLPTVESAVRSIP